MNKGFVCVFLGLFVGFLLGFLATNLIVDEQWIEVPVFACMEGDKVGCINCGKLLVLVSDNKWKKFVYKDLEGKRYENEWEALNYNLNAAKKEMKKENGSLKK